MKKQLLFILLILLSLYSQSQEISLTNEGVNGNFFMGISYTYLNNDMKVRTLSISSVWQGVDFGTNELTNEEIDEINSFARRTCTFNGITLEAGMILFGKPGSRWYVNGSVLMGIGRSYAETFSKNTDTMELVVDNGFTDPCFGIGFNIEHQFNPQWGLLFRPLIVTTFGKSDKVQDAMYPYLENYTETREDKFFTIYERLNVLATFTAGKFRFAAGPGFYYCHSSHEYRVERINNSTGDVLLDEIHTNLVPRSFVDGMAAIEWRFFGPLSLNVSVGIGKDIAARAGLFYSL